MSTTRKPVTEAKVKANRSLLQPLFGRQNIRIMIAGLVVIAIGMLLMSGGKNPDPNVFNNELVYGFRRITLAPIVILLGFAIEIVGIFWREKR
ncbi:DUF3098 domain-containing protein [Haoranjiania flava]|uniref:DUF3098 domain-containing protein n=1 Tax=Haoranjiania flava TaxID=1856322 RepID=A0AAE3IL44_9BACT|nr:DUF3098 domain-containing protein [Haoranjiania flava]MCU7694222.1 DUF3098 domain-containing protein [Haoranjiania flava]